jgi:hypothetical protein
MLTSSPGCINIYICSAEDWDIVWLIIFRVDLNIAICLRLWTC